MEISLKIEPDSEDEKTVKELKKLFNIKANTKLVLKLIQEAKKKYLNE